MEPTIDAYIISWTGQQANAEAIEASLAPHVTRLTVIHSDERNGAGITGERWRVVPNDWFYGPKFRLCLQEFTGEIMLQITADATCDDWGMLVRKCREGFQRLPNLGVWGPEVDVTPYSLGRTAIVRMADSSVYFVAIVDSIVWAMSRDIVGRLRQLDYDANNLGWGIERIAALCCHASNRLVALDNAVQVSHPESRGYSPDEAWAQHSAFMNQATTAEKIHDVLITRYMRAEPTQSI